MSICYTMKELTENKSNLNKQHSPHTMRPNGNFFSCLKLTTKLELLSDRCIIFLLFLLFEGHRILDICSSALSQ